MKKGETPPYRPKCTKCEDDTENQLVELMKKCWEEDPDDRPSIDSVKRKLKVIYKGR